MSDRNKLLQELTEASGLPGYEEEVREVLRRYLEPLAQIRQDKLGSLLALKESSQGRNGPKVMLAAHMDEIGFMVTSITEEGFVKFVPLGGWWEQVLLAQKVIIKSKDGDIPGVIGSKPPHILTEEERKEIVKIKNMFIDIGASGEEEARRWVRPGDPVVPAVSFTPMKNQRLLMAKAWDDRVGCGLIVDIFKNLHDMDHPNQVFGVGTVQEEVGLRGATTSASAVAPDVAFALEVGIAGDVPGVKRHEAQEKLGAGPSILLYDASMVPNIKLRDFAIDTAEREGIPYQFDVMPRGGTDAGRIHIHSQGVPSLVVGVPTRYIHSHLGIIDRDDYDNAVRLMTAVVTRLNAEMVRSFTG